MKQVFVCAGIFVAMTGAVPDCGASTGAPASSYCDFSAACERVYPAGSLDLAVCFADGRDILYGPNPAQIVQFTQQTCERLLDNAQIQKCIDDSGCK